MHQFGYNLSFSDLYLTLEKVDNAFLHMLADTAPDLHKKLLQARTFPPITSEESQLLVELAPYLQDFLSHLFCNQDAVQELEDRHHKLAPIFRLKRHFIQRQALLSEPCTNPEETRLALFESQEPWNDMTFAKAVLRWQAEHHEEKLALALSYAAWAVKTPQGKETHKDGFLFHLPQRIDREYLIPDHVETKKRAGFSHTDPGLSFEQSLNQVHYCIYCHHQGRDSCSKGLKDRKSQDFITLENRVTLKGCPLDEKISEAHELKSQGCVIGALAVIMVDNPMVAATGYRICNDCMKSCIYQKQDPVHIPAVETSILNQVLDLPYGFEIYSLLSRWNPLNIRRPLPAAFTGYHVLVVGMGPAGFTLAHHLLNDGHHVVGVDGLKIEPLPEDLLSRPIVDVNELYEDLSDRIIAGFGGVAEYGITVRWNKNYLKLIRLLLERRKHFHLFDGIRFGGTLTPQQALDLGFDHIALCMGAGKPTLIPMKNGLARGVRQASDFLMTLQLSGAYQADTIANLQIRLPIVVIGGGLTAIDSATEALAYYPIQVTRFLRRYETLVETWGKEAVEESWTEEDHMIAQEFIAHAKELCNTDVSQHLALLQRWGGASVVYRGRLQDSPAYRLNHEEVHKAMREGIRFYEKASPEAVVLDTFGHAHALRLQTPEGTQEKEAKTILIAAGTKPNITLAHETDGRIAIEGHSFKSLQEGAHQIFLTQDFEEHCLSFFGDLHPIFAGSVVKAMASAKQGYPILTQILKKKSPKGCDISSLRDQLKPRVISVKELAPQIVEVIVQAPLAARNFKPGQFYRLQNYGPSFLMEPLALTGAWVDREKGWISLIVLEMGGSSHLCRFLQAGESVVLMGPTGTPTDIAAHKNVILVGGGLGNAVLLSIGEALRQAGSRVIYFAGYKTKSSVFHRERVEHAADQVIWCCEDGELPTYRPQDLSFQGNVVQAIEKFNDEISPFPLQDTQHLIVIGSDRMMAAVQIFFSQHQSIFKKPPRFIASINAPMQCMMKEICAQCLQRHVHPETGEEEIVFSCVHQDQNLMTTDFAFLQQRLKQNALSEKLTAQWIRLTLP